MRAGGFSALLAASCALLVQPAAAQIAPRPPGTMAPCMRQMSLTAVDAHPDEAVLRVTDWAIPFAGDVRVYGHDVMWRATIRGGATAVVPNATRGTLETSVELHAPGAIEGAEFDPRGGSCTLHAGLRPPAPSDGVEVSRPVVVASDPVPVEPPSCATPYAAAQLVHGGTPQQPPTGFGMTGAVRVAVALDAAGEVVATQVLSSPSMVLGGRALSAVRASTFTPEIFRCVAVPDGFVYVATFAG